MVSRYGMFLPANENDDFLYAVEDGTVVVRMGSRGRRIFHLPIDGTEKTVYQDVDGKIVEREIPQRGDLELTVYGSDDPQKRVFRLKYHCQVRDNHDYLLTVRRHRRSSSLGGNHLSVTGADQIKDLRLELMLG